jgi:hypothetical protein
MCMFCRSLFVLLAIVLSVLRFTDSNHPFDNFKLFLEIYTGYKKVIESYSKLFDNNLSILFIINFGGPRGRGRKLQLPV